MFGIGAGEFVVILIVGLIVFGPGKLPELGRALGKALREFRKAQAALSATLNEPLDEPKKNSPPVSNSPPAEKNSPATSTATPSAAQNVTADDVIHFAKNSPLAKESSDEKNFNGNSNVVPADDARASLAGAGRSSNGTDK